MSEAGACALDDAPARSSSPAARARARLLPVAGALLAVLFACGRAPSDGPPVVALDGRALGTTWSLRLVDPEGDADAGELRRMLEACLETVDRAASTWREDSELAAVADLAAEDALPISATLAAVLDVAREVHAASGGAFDPTVGPLVGAYGFGAGADEGSPTEAALDAAAARLGFDAFAWEDGRLTRSRPEVSLDLSGVAKGYAVDLMAEALLDAGETRFLVEVGGELRARGTRRSGTPWVLGIYEPVVARAVHGKVEATDVAMATSGDYRQFRELADGSRVSHTIDPRTGRAAASGLASVTVLAPDCARADALATAVLVLGATEGLELVDRLPGVEAYLLLHADDGFRPRASSGFPEVVPLESELPSAR